MTDTRPLPIPAEVLQRSAEVIKCLGHPMRLRLLELLEHGERSVSDLVDGTCATQSAVSQQLSILRGHGVVDARRDGPFVYYHIVRDEVRHILHCIRACNCIADGTEPSPSSATH
jgi:ArsR family transcriptional regulator